MKEESKTRELNNEKKEKSSTGGLRRCQSGCERAEMLED
jgi:hypothetical protein